MTQGAYRQGIFRERGVAPLEREGAGQIVQRGIPPGNRVTLPYPSSLPTAFRSCRERVLTRPRAVEALSCDLPSSLPTARRGLLQDQRPIPGFPLPGSGSASQIRHLRRRNLGQGLFHLDHLYRRRSQARNTPRRIPTHDPSSAPCLWGQSHHRMACSFSLPSPVTSPMSSVSVRVLVNAAARQGERLNVQRPREECIENIIDVPAYVRHKLDTSCFDHVSKRPADRAAYDCVYAQSGELGRTRGDQRAIEYCVTPFDLKPVTDRDQQQINSTVKNGRYTAVPRRYGYKRFHRFVTPVLHSPEDSCTRHAISMPAYEK